MNLISAVVRSGSGSPTLPSKYAFSDSGSMPVVANERHKAEVGLLRMSSCEYYIVVNCANFNSATRPGTAVPLAQLEQCHLLQEAEHII